MENVFAVMGKGEPMSDLISTQEAVVKIVDTAIRKIMSGEQKLTKEYEQSVINAVNVILNTAQCEIIHCRDCKHHHYERNIPYCDRIDYGYGCKDNDYCSLAERRTDGV